MYLFVYSHGKNFESHFSNLLSKATPITSFLIPQVTVSPHSEIPQPFEYIIHIIFYEVNFLMFLLYVIYSILIPLITGISILCIIQIRTRCKLNIICPFYR